MESTTTNGHYRFAQAEQTAHQCLTQAQMALAFLGDEERANRVTSQLDRMSESLEAMQTQHAALVAEHATLREQFEEQRDRFSGGLVTEPMEGQRPTHGWNQTIGRLKDRLSALALLVVTMGVLVAMAAGAAQSHSNAHPAGASSGAQGATSAPRHLGDTITAGIITCTLLSVALPPWEEGGVQNVTESQDVIVRVSLRNIGRGFVSYNLANFRLKLGTGDDANEEIPMNEAQPGAWLAPGTSGDADLVFAVRRGDHATELAWKPLLGGDENEHTWLLGV